MQVREQRRGQLRCTVQCHAYFPNVRRHLLDDAGLAQGGRRRGGRAVDGQAASGSHCHRCAGAQRHNRECAEDERAADGDSRLHRDDDYVCVCVWCVWQISAAAAGNGGAKVSEAHTPRY